MAETPQPKPSEILRRARALIDAPEKWCQRVSRTTSGQHCAAGAMLGVSGAGHISDVPGSVFLERVMGRYICNFNDAPSRTHAEVMQKFDEAIALAESENQ